MNENIDPSKQAKLNSWIKKELDAAVQKLTKQDGFDGLLIEAKPAWVLPFQILIGQVRPQGKQNEFQWCICGEVPTDFLQSSIANTPREALRHFSMKWQLAAARHQKANQKNQSRPPGALPEENPVDMLATHAEDLYGLVEDDRLWAQG